MFCVVLLYRGRSWTVNKPGLNRVESGEFEMCCWRKMLEIEQKQQAIKKVQ